MEWGYLSDCSDCKDPGYCDHEVAEDDVVPQVSILMHPETMDELTAVEYSNEGNKKNEDRSAWAWTEDEFDASLQVLLFINCEEEQTGQVENQIQNGT